MKRQELSLNYFPDLSRSVRNNTTDRIVLSDMMHRVSDLKDRENIIEDEISRIAEKRDDIRLLMTIPGIHVYSAAAIVAEIDDISRFEKKEKLAAYAGLVPRQDQSGSRDIRGHISKHGPSMLRFVLVTAAHTVIRYSRRMKQKNLSIDRRLGRNRAIVAIARILLETIYTMLSRNMEFIDNIDTLTEGKMKAMSERAKHPERTVKLDDAIKLIMEKSHGRMSRELFS